MRPSGEIRSQTATPPSPSYMTKDEFGTNLRPWILYLDWTMALELDR